MWSLTNKHLDIVHIEVRIRHPTKKQVVHYSHGCKIVHVYPQKENGED